MCNVSFVHLQVILGLFSQEVRLDEATFVRYGSQKKIWLIAESAAWYPAGATYQILAIWLIKYNGLLQRLDYYCIVCDGVSFQTLFPAKAQLQPAASGESPKILFSFWRVTPVCNLEQNDPMVQHRPI